MGSVHSTALLARGQSDSIVLSVQPRNAKNMGDIERVRGNAKTATVLAAIGIADLTNNIVAGRSPRSRSNAPERDQEPLRRAWGSGFFTGSRRDRVVSPKKKKAPTKNAIKGGRPTRLAPATGFARREESLVALARAIHQRHVARRQMFNGMKVELVVLVPMCAAVQRHRARVGAKLLAFSVAFSRILLG